MVSFVCEACQETLKKQKLDQHKQRCHYAQFTCVDCSVTFQGNDYKAHTSCISEAEKYQKSVYKAPKKQQQQQKQAQSTTITPVAVKEAVANVAVAPKAAPLIVQLEKNEVKSEESKEDKKESKKIAKEFDFKKTIKSVLKKNSSLTLSELKTKVISKLAKKNEGASKEDIGDKFDASIVASLAETIE
ncbi:UNVERIFIED_CONTAM: hypothetical protein HDU68_010376 [Siphonaria sp. JEL0065]|nr:hypothetical protein HDU68_010376 [Siphonaria sp. JEL0065]